MVFGSSMLMLLRHVRTTQYRSMISLQRGLANTNMPKKFHSPMMENEKTVIELLRDELKHENIQAYPIPSTDPHMSEYIAPYFSRREFVSGFTGSSGIAIVTLNEAVVFADGRYHTQLDIELDQSLKENLQEQSTPSEPTSLCSSQQAVTRFSSLRKGNWKAMKLGLPGVPSHLEYLSQQLKAGDTVGFDSLLHSASEVKKMKKIFHSKHILTKALTTGNNLVDRIWKENQPLYPNGKIRVHPVSIAGVSVSSKIAKIRMILREQKCDSLVISALDEIMWVLNIRGSDIPHNPVALGYLLVTAGE